MLRALVLLFALSLPAFADEPPPQEEASLEGYGAAHPQCREWSDGCAVCLRDSGVHCSTPGIACQPQEIACKAP